MADAARFWMMVDQSDAVGCWVWTGSHTRTGYGHFRLTGVRTTLAHRAAWTLAHGPIPKGLCVLHRCDNRRCVRPDHLFLGTQAENVADMHAKGRDRKARGVRHHNAKLDPDKIREIRRLRALGVSQSKIGRMFGVPQTCISSIDLRKTWGHVE